MVALGEHLLDGASVVSRPRTLVRHLTAPLLRLPVALGQRGEGASRKEGFACAANRALDASFLITRAHLAGTRDEVIVSAQLKQARVQVNFTTPEFQRSTAEIVVDDHARLGRPTLKGMHVAAQKVFHGLIEEELQIERA